MLHVDHPLSAEGVQQAVALNACWQEHELNLRAGFLHELNDPTLAQMHRVFTDADTPVLSSPLTRAAQTALLSLRGHHGLANSARGALLSADPYR